jgi:hypothetical protein
MKQGDFHSNRFFPDRDFPGLDSDFVGFCFQCPVSRINSAAPSLGELKRLLSPLLRKRKHAGANLIFPFNARRFLRTLARTVYEAIIFAGNSLPILLLLSYK